MGELGIGEGASWMRILAIDPGDVHVGFAVGEKVIGEEGKSDWAVTIGEWEHDEAPWKVQAIVQGVRGIDEMVIEEYVLYQEKAAMQTWSRLKTPELIGMLRMVAEQKGVRVEMQGAYIKKGMRAQLKARGIKREVGGGKGSHANDAFLHLWYRILKQGY